MDNTLKKELYDKGYVLFNKPLSDVSINRALSSIVKTETGEKLNYNTLNEFIKDDFFGFINSKFEWNSIYEKFRFSNKSNSRDASTFHADVYNYSDEPHMPIYTCLIYFDDATLEIIPGSHLRTDNDSTNDLYSKRTQLNIKGGSILVFNANMYHRGIFYKSGVIERKLLQVFDVYPSKEIYDKYQPQYLKVNTNSSGNMSTINDLSELTSKNKTVNELVNYLHFWLVRNDIQYKFHKFDNPRNCKYIGYIPGNIGHIEPGLQNWNINLHLNKDVNLVTSSTNYFLILKMICIVIAIIFIIKYRTNITKRIIKLTKTKN